MDMTNGCPASAAPMAEAWAPFRMSGRPSGSARRTVIGVAPDCADSAAICPANTDASQSSPGSSTISVSLAWSAMTRSATWAPRCSVNSGVQAGRSESAE